MRPLVSIVTPVLNGARFLPECLASVRAQNYPRLEHVVVDGGSTDGTLELLAAAPGIRWVTGRDCGMYDALRRGFELAQGDVFAYQNADDRYAHADAVAWAVEWLEAHPEADLAWGDFRWIDARGEELTRRARRVPPARQDDILRYNFVPPHAAFVRARVVRDEGLGPDPSFQYAGDWEWYVRLHRAGKRFTHLPRLLADFRLHAGAKTATFARRKLLGEWRRVCRRHGLSFASVLWHGMFWMPLRFRLAHQRQNGESCSHPSDPGRPRC